MLLVYLNIWIDTVVTMAMNKSLCCKMAVCWCACLEATSGLSKYSLSIMPRLVLSLCFEIAALYGFCPFYTQSSFTIGISPSMLSCCLQRAFCNFVSKTQIDNSSKQCYTKKPSFCPNLEAYECCFYACSEAVLSAIVSQPLGNRGNNEGFYCFVLNWRLLL